MNRISIQSSWLALAGCLLIASHVWAENLTLEPAETEPRWSFHQATIARSVLGDRFVRLENEAGKMASLNSPALETAGLPVLEVAFSYRTAVAGSRSDFGAWVLIGVLDGKGQSLSNFKVICPSSSGWNTLHREFTLPAGAAKAGAQFRLQSAPGRFDLKQIELATRPTATGGEVPGIPLREVERLRWNRNALKLESPQRTLIATSVFARSNTRGAMAFPWPGSRDAHSQAVYEIEATFTVGPGLADGKNEALFTLGRNMNGPAQPNSMTLMVWGGKSLFTRLSSLNAGLSGQVITNIAPWRAGQKHTARVRFSAREITLWLDGKSEGSSQLARPFCPVEDRPVFIGGESATESLWSGTIESLSFTILQPRLQAAFADGCEAGCFRGPGPHEWRLDFPAGEGEKVVSSFHVEDADGQRVGQSFEPKEHTARAHRVVLPTLPYGRYTLCADLQFEGVRASVSRAFAIVNPWSKRLPAGQSSFGIQMGFPMTPEKFDAAVMRESFSLAAASGARWWRLWLRWDDIETEPGVYHWDALDQTVAAAQELGLALLPNITGGALPFQTTQPLKKEKWPLMTPACYAPADMGRWSAFLNAMAGRYRGKVGYWQIWNEPDARNGLYPFSPKTYADILKASAAAIRAADPKVKIVLGGFCSALMGDGTKKASHTDADCAWGAAEFYALKPEADYDIADSHFYSASEPGQSWERVKSEAEGARRYLESIGEGHKPFWNSETSMYSGKVGEIGGWANIPFISEAAQAEELAKLHVQSLAAGIERTFWYGLRGDIGIFNEDASPKAAFVAQVNLVRLMQGARFIKEHSIAPNLRAYEFAVGGRSILALWSMGNQVPVCVRSEKKGPWIDCDLYGNERKGSPGFELLKAGSQPHFLISKTLPNVEALIQLEHGSADAGNTQASANILFTNPSSDPTTFTFALTAGDAETTAQSLSLPANGKTTVSIPLPARRNPVRVDARAVGGLNQTIELEERFKFRKTVRLKEGQSARLLLDSAAQLEIGAQRLDLQGRALSDSAWHGKDDLSAEVTLTRKGSVLEFVAAVTDSTVCPATTEHQLWNGDCLELFFNLSSDDRSTDSYQVMLAPDGRVAWRADQALKGFQSTAARTVRGYRIAGTIPLAGRTAIGWDVALDDKDDETGRKSQIFWSRDETTERVQGCGGVLLFAE